MKSALTGIIFLLALGLQVVTCAPEPIKISNEAVVPHAFITDNLIFDSALTIDTTLFRICDTVQTGDTVTFFGTVIPPDNRITSVLWKFSDGKEDTSKIVKHTYVRSGIFPEQFYIFDGVGNSLCDTVIVSVNTPPDSVVLIGPKDGSTVEASYPIMLSWKGYDTDLFDTTLSYLVVGTRDNRVDTIVYWDTVTSITINQSITMEKKITWYIVAKDQYGASKSSKTFTFFIDKTNGLRPLLKDLRTSIGKLSPDFIDTIFTYAKAVTTETQSLTITAIPSDTLSVISINDIPLSKNDTTKSVLIQFGVSKTITVKVESGDGLVSNTYTINFVPSDTLLASLQLSAGTLMSVAFPVPDTIRDTVSFIDSVITVTPFTFDTQSIVIIDSFSVKSGSVSPTFKVLVGTKVIKITVISSNSSKSKMYILHIVRKADSATPLTSPPVLVEATGISVSIIRITWDDNPDATYYTLQRSKDTSSVFNDLARVTNNAFTDSTLDSGSTWYYRVSASNTGGSTVFSKAVFATTFLKPNFLMHPQSIKVIEGGYGILTAKAEGIPIPTYQWQKNMADLKISTASCTTAVLSIGDNGAIYRCIIRNAASEVTSNEALVTVDSLFTKPAIQRQPFDTGIFVGDSITLFIADSGSYLKRQWRIDGINIPGATSCTLSIKNIKSTDAGSYSVKIWNRSDSALSTPFQLQVFPKGDAGLAGQALSATSINVMWNAVEGANWYRVLRASEGNIFALTCSTSQVSIIDSLLTEGTLYSYKLIAGNSSSEKRTNDSIAIMTWYGPRISKQPKTQRIVAGQTINLSVVATAMPACSYIWKKNGTTITGATLSEYKLTNAAPVDSGDYSVQVTNNVRTVNSSSVRVSVIPTYTITASAVPSVGGSITMSKAFSVYERGDTIKLTARAASGYRFKGWSGDTITVDTMIVLVVKKNTLVYANFIKQYTLSMSNSSNGSVIPAGTSAVDSGASISITATPDKGCKFISWKLISGNAFIVDTAARSTTLKLTWGNAGVQGRFSDPDTGWSSGCGKTLSTMKLDTGTYTITSEGLSREYIVYIPVNYNVNKPYKLMFCWHTVGSNMNVIANGKGITNGGINWEFYGLKCRDTNKTTIFVAPNGMSGEWTLGEKDHTFFNDMLKLINDEVCIDTTRVYSVGFSGGAIFTFSLAQNHQKQLRGVACIAANSVYYIPPNTGEPLSYIGISGLSDVICQPDKGRACRDRFILNNGGDISETATETNVGSLKHEVYNYKSVNPKYPVRWCTFDGVHNPAPYDGSGSSSDGTRTWVPEEIWQFFSQF